MKNITLLAISLFFHFHSPISSFAQDAPNKKTIAKLYPNTFKQYIGNFYVRQSPGIEQPVRQLGLYYERKIYRHIFIGVGYAQWDAIRILSQEEDIFISEKPISIPYTPVIGDLEYRFGYKMLDGYAFHEFNVHSERHFINVGLGLSYCWGQNLYLKYYVQGTPTDATADYDWRTEHYWGLIPVISYNYLLLKNRLSIGADLKGRYYSGRAKAQYDYGIHIGVKF